MTLDQQLESGISHHRAGRLAEAEKIYRQVLAHQPDHAEALNLLGVLAGQAGQLNAAVELIRRAIRLKPDLAQAHCNLGVVLKRNGRLDDAIDSYRQAVCLKPDYAEAHSNLGNALLAVGQLDEAIASHRQAVRLVPDLAEAHFNLGIALQRKGPLDEAIVAYRQAVLLKPDHAEAHNNLGSALRDIGQLDESIAACRQAVRLKPDYAEAHNNLGNTLCDVRQLDEAVASYRQAIRLKPDYVEAHNNLGNVLRDKGQLDEAIAACRQALRLKPDLAEAHVNLANALRDMRQPDEAVAACRQAIRLNPDFAGAHSTLGAAFKDMGQLDDAIAACRHAIRLKPDFAEAHCNLANALKDVGQLDQAIACYRQAMRLKPGDCFTHSNLIYTLHYHPHDDGRMIQEGLRLWNRQHAEPLQKFILPHTNNRDPHRRLRIGYVSPDFSDHPVGRFLLPLLANHDHQCVEVFAYAKVPAPDATTRRLRAHTDAWRDVVGLSDAQAADLIRQDRIDVLVDLSLHTANNCLLIFAQKPAPVQVTYLAYPGSSGLTTMDYRLSDPYLDPPGADESAYSEQTLRLPETYWCYSITRPAPEPPPLPATAAGYITFGCLNNFVKVSPPALDLWADILQAIPRSRLILHSNPGTHLDVVRERFAGKGISPDRLEFYLEWGNWPKYLQTYGRIDLALDPFPYGGGTTTCDGLWMGVPVVSLAGKTAVGRAGLSLLSNVGLPDLVANTPEQYVRLAVSLANDLPRLKDLHSTLRQRMQVSPLMDAPRFAGNIEAAYRQMWRTWCQESGNSTRPVTNDP